MSVRREKIVANLLVCAGIFTLGFTGGKITPAIAAMAFVQSVNVPEMVEAYREAKNPPAIRYQDDEPPRKRQ